MSNILFYLNKLRSKQKRNELRYVLPYLKGNLQ